MMHEDAASPASLLASIHTIAVVGLSPNPRRPSHEVFAFLLARGFACVGVNPGLAGRRLLGAPVFASLTEVDRPVDMIDIFRDPAAVGGIVDEALALRPLPRAIWMQLGVIDHVAAARAETAGLQVVMDRCPKIELSRARGG